MKRQLLERGIEGAVFEIEDGRRIQGDEMSALCHTLASMGEALIALERRGIKLREHAERRDPETGKLPVMHVFLGLDEYWFRGRLITPQTSSTAPCCLYDGSIRNVWLDVVIVASGSVVLYFLGFLVFLLGLPGPLGLSLLSSFSLITVSACLVVKPSQL